jgi:hypothetical protein
MNEAATWERLCELIDDDELLWPEVQTALAEGEDPWEALLDGLDDSGAMAYLDEGDTGMELTDALVQLPRVFRLKPDLGEVTDTDDLDAAMRTADAVLAAADHRLLRLEEPDSDAHALVVVPSGSVAEIERLAETLGHPVTVAG